MSNLFSSNDVKVFEDRFGPLYIAIAVTALVVFSRLWYLQIIKGEELKAYSDKNRVKETKIVAARGLILDRNENVLVENLQGFAATIIPQYASKLESTIKDIAPVLKMSADEILKEVKESKRQNGLFRPVQIKNNLGLDEVTRIKNLALHNPGLNIDANILRHYPLNDNGAQLFGYVGEISKGEIRKLNKKYPDQQFEQGDIIGKSGLELVWEDTIRGINGVKLNEVDARGRGRNKESASTSFLGLKQQEARPGLNVSLTIDKDIQEAALKAMNREDKIGPRVGALVAMKSNGEILAWVNTPSYDPNEFSLGISKELWVSLVNDDNKPLRNKVIQDHYPPASTFKPIVALAALQENIIKQNTEVFSPGFWKFGSRRYHDYNRAGYGNINVKEAIERSSNIFFYKMGDKLGIDNIAKYTKLLGLGSRTGIKLENEKPGLVPTKAWKLKRKGEEWQPGENLSNAIGQGFMLATPLQMALAYNTIGNEGLVYKPFIVKKIINSKGDTVKEFEPQLLRDVSKPNKDGVFISKKNFKVVKKGMKNVVHGDRGSARWYKLPGIEYAGKTGTVQLRAFSADQIYEKCDKRPVEIRHHGWFSAFAPVKNPEITVAVLSEHSCGGSSGSAPVVRDVMLAYFKKYHPELLKTKKKRNAKIKTASNETKKKEQE